MHAAVWQNLGGVIGVDYQVSHRRTFEDMFGVACHCHIVRPGEEVQASEVLEQGVERVGDRELARHAC